MPSSIDLGHLHIIGVDVEDVVVLMLIDDRPFFHRAAAHSLIDPIWIENLAVDQDPEFLRRLSRTGIQKGVGKSTSAPATLRRAPALAGFAADERESKEVEDLRFADAAGWPPASQLDLTLRQT